MIFDQKSFLRRLLVMKAACGENLEEKTATGNPATFTTDVAKALSGLSIPISSEGGVSGITIYRTGTNLWDEVWENGTLNGSGGNSASNDNIRSKNYIPVVPGAKYYIKYSVPGGASGNMKLYYYNASKTYLSNSWVNSAQVTVPSGAYYARFYMDTKYGNTYNNNISFNYPSSNTSYNVYEGTSVTLDFGEAVNAGTLDALKGELTVTSPESKTITLEPVKITAIAGDNVVTTDNGGSATVKYKKKV